MNGVGNPLAHIPNRRMVPQLLAVADPAVRTPTIQRMPIPTAPASIVVDLAAGSGFPVANTPAHYRFSSCPSLSACHPTLSVPPDARPATHPHRRGAGAFRLPVGPWSHPYQH